MLLVHVRIHPNWFSIIFWIIIIFLVILTYFYIHKQTESLSDIWLYLKILTISLIMILFLLLFIYAIIRIYFTIGITCDKEKESILDMSKQCVSNESWIFMIANALIFGMYVNIIGLGIKNTNKFLKYFIAFILIYVSLSGFGYFGIRITFSEPISDYLYYDIWQSNSTDGIRFFTYNILLFMLIYIITIFTESEI